jgi:hypothetical protein
MLVIIILSEINHEQKDQHHLFPLREVGNRKVFAREWGEQRVEKMGRLTNGH